MALAYAASVHKSQGSKYPAVVIPLMMRHYMMLRRNLLYTGITRGRRLVVLVGQKQAVGIAVKGRVETRRWSKRGSGWPEAPGWRGPALRAPRPLGTSLARTRKPPGTRLDYCIVPTRGSG